MRRRHSMVKPTCSRYSLKSSSRPKVSCKYRCCAGLITSERTSTFTGRNEFIKSPNSDPGNRLRRTFKNAAYRNSRRMAADNPIQIANMALDIGLLSVLHANSNPAHSRGQCKLRLHMGTLVIQKCPKMELPEIAKMPYL